MDLEKKFNEIKKSHSSEKINDFLIQLAEHPYRANWKMVDFFFEELEKEIFEKIKINLVFIIGEISTSKKVPNKYLNFLVDIYYQSDRWVRNEIMKAFKNIVDNQEVNKKIIDLLTISIKEEYLPLRKNALEVVFKLENFGFETLKNVLIIMRGRDADVLDKSKKIVRKAIKNEKELFEILNTEELYKMINKEALRAVLTTFFKTILNIEPFRNRIKDADWESEFKQEFIKEIDTFQKIMLKNL